MRVSSGVRTKSTGEQPGTTCARCSSAWTSDPVNEDWPKTKVAAAATTSTTRLLPIRTRCRTDQHKPSLSHSIDIRLSQLRCSASTEPIRGRIQVTWDIVAGRESASDANYNSTYCKRKWLQSGPQIRVHYLTF